MKISHSRTFILFSGLLWSGSAIVSQSTTRPTTTHNSPSASSQSRALASLTGKTAYLCPVRPPIKYFEDSYEFSDTKDGSGASVDPIHVPDYFDSKQSVVILSAEKGSGYSIGLRLQNSVNHAQTTLSVSVDKTWFRNAFEGVTGNGFLSKSPVPAFPRIGMTSSDVYCIMGSPEQTNSDALGGDQLVYRRSHVYVYISPRTDRVTNVQSSY